MTSKPTTLLLLSGGIDSAYCLWQRVQQGLPTRTHHVVLKDWEGRQRVESAATDAILRWINVNGGSGLITHTESSVDFGTQRWIPKNFYLWSYWAGVLFADPRNDLANIIIPRHSDAFAGGPQSPGALKSDSAYKTTIELISGQQPNLLYPMVHMTKAEVVQAMPSDLLARTWYCRRPTTERKPCKKCMTCQQVEPALAAKRGS